MSNQRFIDPIRSAKHKRGSITALDLEPTFALRIPSATQTSLLTPTYEFTTSDIKEEPIAWGSMTNNSVTLAAGTWELEGNISYFTKSGGLSPGFLSFGYKWAGANGGDTATEPASLDTDICTVVHGEAYPKGPGDALYTTASGGAINGFNIVTNPFTLTVSEEYTVYLDPFESVTDYTQAAIRLTIRARRVL